MKRFVFLLLVWPACGKAGNPEFAALSALWTQPAETAMRGETRRFVREGREASPALPGVRLHFENGERVAGEILSWTPERMELRAPWGQTLVSTRQRLRGMEFVPAGKGLLLDGPAALTEWRTDYPGKPPPRRIGNELASHTELYNVVCARLPAGEGGLEFLIRLRLPEGLESWGLYLFNERAETRNGLHSLCVWQDDTGIGLRVNQGENPANFRFAKPLAQAPGRELELRIRVDFEATRVQVLVDDVMAHDVVNPALAHFRQGVPFWMHLQPHGNGIVVVEELRVEENRSAVWSDVARPKGDRALLVLRNGDQLEAKLQSIGPETVDVLLDGSRPLTLPRAVLSRILFPTVPAAEEDAAPVFELKAGPARSRLHLQGVSWKGEHLHGSSRNWDTPLRIPLADVDELSW